MDNLSDLPDLESVLNKNVVRRSDSADLSKLPEPESLVRYSLFSTSEVVTRRIRSINPTARIITVPVSMSMQDISSSWNLFGSFCVPTWYSNFYDKSQKNRFDLQKTLEEHVELNPDSPLYVFCDRKNSGPLGDLADYVKSAKHILVTYLDEQVEPSIQQLIRRANYQKNDLIKDALQLPSFAEVLGITQEPARYKQPGIFSAHSDVTAKILSCNPNLLVHGFEIYHELVDVSEFWQRSIYIDRSWDVGHLAELINRYHIHNPEQPVHVFAKKGKFIPENNFLEKIASKNLTKLHIVDDKLPSEAVEILK